MASKMAPDLVTATLGLGGNIGDPVAAMARALAVYDHHADCKLVAVSRLYRTPPWGKTDQDDFYNACAVVMTRLAPEDLLDLGLSIEQDAKRTRIERWGPRTLDIDVLTYGDIVRRGDRLELPHPRMTGRGFVMMPLNDIAPDLVVEGQSVAQWLAGLETDGILPVSDNGDWWRSVK